METVTGLTNGTTYTFRVTARNANGLSEPTDSRSVTPVGPPTRPLNLSYAALDNAVNVKFTKPDNDGGFGLSNYEYSTNNGSSWTALSPPSVSESITINGLTNSSVYQVKLRAVTPYGSGSPSVALAVTPGVTVYRSVSYSAGTLDAISGLASGGTYTEGQSFTVAAGPTRSNFTFENWSDGSNTYAPNSIYTIGAANVNLTAQWRQSSLVGTTNSDISRVLTWNIVGSEAIDATVSSDGGNSSVRVEIPANTFDAGTEVIFWRLTNQNVSKNVINSSYDFLVNFAISWSIGDDITTPKRVLTARNPVQVTITNASIAKDATGWMILGGVATKLGTASQAGELRVSITEDPIITAANVTVADVVRAAPALSAQEMRRIRETEIDAARKLILNLVRLKKDITPDLFVLADVSGANPKNIKIINFDIRELADSSKEKFSNISQVVLKYFTVDKVASNQKFYYSDLAKVGLAPEQSKVKTSIVRELSRRDAIEVDTVEKIKDVVASVEKEFNERTSRLASIIAKIKARFRP